MDTRSQLLLALPNGRPLRCCDHLQMILYSICIVALFYIGVDGSCQPVQEPQSVWLGDSFYARNGVVFAMPLRDWPTVRSTPSRSHELRHAWHMNQVTSAFSSFRPHPVIERSGNTMAVAELSMYTEPAAVNEAYVELARSVATRLGFELETAPTDLASLWRHPQLLLAQTCGYPWITQLRDEVQLVAAPRYAFQGCDGPRHCSFILVPEASTAISLEDLRDTRVAINGPDSNSGMNLLRDAVAPLAVQGRFFREVIRSGSHANSMKLLQLGQADVAAVDAVTYGYLQRDAPDRLAGLRVLQRSRQSPALPLVCAATHTNDTVQALRTALSATLVERPKLAQALAIEGFDPVSEDTYLPILHWQEEAIKQGYAAIA